MSIHRLAVCALALTIVAGCAKSGPPRGGVAGNQPVSTFPLYQPSTITASSKYDDSLEVTRFGSSFFSSGPTAAYPYVGTQELAKTSANLTDLEAWTKKLAQSPPEGFRVGQGLTDQDQGTANSAPPSPGQSNSPWLAIVNDWGLVPYIFWNKERDHVILMYLIDPKALANHMGPTLPLIDEWEKMPALVRSGIDATLKKQVGLSASDLIDPTTPIGMMTYVARNWKDQDTRAIILIDATRQPNPLPTPHNT